MAANRKGVISMIIPLPTDHPTTDAALPLVLTKLGKASVGQSQGTFFPLSESQQLSQMIRGYRRD